MAASKVTCYCGAVNFPIKADLPAVTELCHCNPCRQTSGALYEAFVPLDEPPPQSALEKCTAYSSSHDHNRYFCSTCGTKLFINIHRPEKGEDRWTALAGAIDPPAGTENISSVEENLFVGDTIDGGMAPFMTKVGGRDIPSYFKTEESGKRLSSTDLDTMTQTYKSLPALSSDSLLKAECRCKGVSLRIKPVDHTATDTPQRFMPDEKDKYFARACVCRDCRLHEGSTLAFWLYIPPSQILNPHTGRSVAQGTAALTEAGKAANEGLSLRQCSRHNGHYLATRSFCSTCGASVFYDFDHRQAVTNVAGGLVVAEEGVMARRWVSWPWGATSHAESYVDKGIRDAWIEVAERKEYAPTY